MSGRRRGFIAIAGAMLVLGAGALVVQAASGPEDRQAAAPVSTLYLVQSSAGTLDGKGEKLRLKLFDPGTTVTTFTDRPARIGSTESLNDLVKSWKRTFGGDPPNAALQIDRAPRSRDVALLELGKPKLTNKATSLSFPAKRLTGTGSVGLRTFADGGDPRAGGEFSRSTLFIDDGAAAAPFGYQVNFYLFGPGDAPDQLQLDLANSQFSGVGNTVHGDFGFGQVTSPQITTNLSESSLTLGFSNQEEVLWTMDVDLPTSGNAVEGNATVPQNYVLVIESEAGQTTVRQSGPISFPAPPPPE